MTNEEFESLKNDFMNFFDDIPNPEQEPLRFEYYMKLYKYCKSQENKQNENP